MNNLIAQLYTPDFENFVEIEGLRFCRADSEREPKAELCYFREIPLQYLFIVGPYWAEQIDTHLINEECVSRRLWHYITVPFVARIGHNYPAYKDYAVYMGWPFPKYIKLERLDEVLLSPKYLPHQVAQFGDKVDQELAESLFPHLIEEGMVYRG